MNTIKSYQAALDFMYAQLPMYQRQGAAAFKKDLSNTIRLCAAANHPEKDIRCIHIAGTNGKGTTTHIIAGGLQAQGYKVGVYTSPHYKDFRERIKINGEYISKQYIIQFLNKYKYAISEIQPSFFEMTVALAFCYFKDQKVDYAVIETGLGGRLDSTNIILPMLSVITNISFDHQNMLGNTLQAIASEKAGIIKPDTPVIIGERQKEIEEVFIQKANTEHAPISFAEDFVQLTDVQQYPSYIQVSVTCNGRLWLKDLVIDLIGPFQQKNLVTGLYALKVLSEDIKIDFELIKDFFVEFKKNTGYIGRWQKLSDSPLIIADSAHNEGGLKIIMNEISKLSFEKLHIVVGFVNDKDVKSVLQLFPKEANYYYAKANIPRGLDAKELQTIGKTLHLNGKAYSSVRKALAAAKKNAHQNDFIYVGGSIFVVAEVI